MTAEFLLTSLIVVVIPGTGVLYTVSAGLFRGAGAGLAAAFGCTLGILPHLLASAVGVAALMHASAMAFQVVKYVGVAYLLHLAWGMWKETGTLAVGASRASGGLRAIILRGILVNILNPKLTIFFLAFLPQFIPADAASPLAQMVLLSGVFMAMTFAVFVVYALCAHAFRASLIDSPGRVRWMQRGFAGVFALLGLRLALASR